MMVPDSSYQTRPTLTGSCRRRARIAFLSPPNPTLSRIKLSRRVDAQPPRKVNQFSDRVLPAFDLFSWLDIHGSQDSSARSMNLWRDG
jgi:hypothetical protein